MADLRQILSQIYSGGFERPVNRFRELGQDIGTSISDYQMGSRPPVEPGPRFGIQGPHQARKPQPIGETWAGYPTAEPSDYIEQAIARAESNYDAPIGPPERPEEAPPPMAQVGQGGQALPSGDPEKNEYDSIVNSYLTRLQQPSNFPQPRPLTKTQMWAIVLNPDKANELRDMYQGEDYRRRIAQFQYDENRQGQAAQFAERIGERQAEMKRRDAERAWFRESALANSGAPVPQGYMWKNPELQSVWQSKSKKDQREEARLKIAEDRAKGIRPQNRRVAEGELFDDISRLRQMLASQSGQQWMIMRNAGVSDPMLDSVYAGIASDLEARQAEHAAISAMDDQDYSDFIKMDGRRQQQFIQDYIEALRARGATPGNTATTAPRSP